MTDPIIEFKGWKIFRNGFLVGAVWEFRGDWFCRIFTEPIENLEKRFHSEKNAKDDAYTRAKSITDERAAMLPGLSIPQTKPPTFYSD